MTGYTKTYLLSSILDFVLLLIGSCCLEAVVMQGFFVSEGLTGAVGMRIALTAVLLFLLFGSGAHRNLRVPLAALSVLLAVGIIAWGVVSSVGDPIADTEQSNVRFAFVLALAPILMFLLSRRRGTFVILVPVVLLVVGFIQYAYRSNLYLESLLVFGCLAALFAYRSFLDCVYEADSTGKVNFATSGLTAVLPPFVAILIGIVLFFAVVAPLNPDYIHVKLFTEERTLETIDVDNPYSYVEVEDESMTSTTTTDEMLLGNKRVEVNGSSFDEDIVKRYTDETMLYSGSEAGEDANGDESQNNFYAFEMPTFWWMLLVSMAALIIVAAILFRKVARLGRTYKIIALPRSQQVGVLYTSLLKRFDKLGMGKPRGMTPTEFAQDSEARMYLFNQSGATWADVSDVYVRSHYGGEEPNDEDISKLWRFNNAFNKGAILLKGRLKYCLKYYWTL